MSKEIFHTAEAVTEGHPDKICDGIAASILDEAILTTPEGYREPRVAMEVSAKGNNQGGKLWLFGEITLARGVLLDYESIARQTIKNIGYTDKNAGFWDGLDELNIDITQQSADIDSGVSRKRTGAGDQGLMYGGAVVDGPEFMPLPIILAHALANKLTDVRKHTLEYLRPDGKTQVVVTYRNGKAVGIDHVVLAASHDTHVDIAQVRADLVDHVIVPTLDAFNFGITDDTKIIINGAGPWTEHGPRADAGTTNRKIIVDTYGGYFPHGGGGLNGKDPTKVDLSGALAARYLAKALVANELARKVQIEVGYTIGQPEPIIVNIDTFRTEKVSSDVIKQKAKKILDLSVDTILEKLDLYQPIYLNAAVGGFFGRSEFPWEQIPSI